MKNTLGLLIINIICIIRKMKRRGDFMEESKTMFDFADVIILLLSVYIPFIININSEKVKGHKENILTIARTLEIVILEMTHNNARIRAICRILKEYMFVPTKYYGRNLKITNRKKHYWSEIIVSDFNRVKKIDTSILSKILNIPFSEDIVLKIYEYNNLIDDFKDIIHVYGRGKLFLNNKEIEKMTDLMDKIVYESEKIQAVAKKLANKTKHESEGLEKMYRMPKNISKLSMFLVILIFAAHLMISYRYGISILDITIVKTIYFSIPIINALVGLTMVAIVFRK